MLERLVSVYNNETARMPSMVFAVADYLIPWLQPDKCCFNASKCIFSMVQGIYTYAAPLVISRIYIYCIHHSWHDTITLDL